MDDEARAIRALTLATRTAVAMLGTDTAARDARVHAGGGHARRCPARGHRLPRRDQGPFTPRDNVVIARLTHPTPIDVAYVR